MKKRKQLFINFVKNLELFTKRRWVENEDSIIELVKENAELRRALGDIFMMAEEARRGYLHKSYPENNVPLAQKTIQNLYDILYINEVRSVIREHLRDNSRRYING